MRRGQETRAERGDPRRAMGQDPSFPLPGFDEDSWLDAREAFWERHFLLAGADGARVNTD